MDRTYANETLRRAVAVLGDERAADQDREDAAVVVQAIMHRARPSEADLSDLLNALGRSLHVRLAVRRVVNEIKRLWPVTVGVQAGHGIERMMARVHREGDHGALCELLLAVLNDHRWRPWIREEWGRDALEWAVSQLPDSTYRAACLVSGWIHAFGGIPSWMREAAEAHPGLVTSSFLPREVRWTLHRAAPSAAGWRSLASAVGWPPMVEPALFGHEADGAVETLQQAIGESTDERARLRLRLWLRELTGATS